MQLHRAPLRIALSVGIPDVAQAAGAGRPIVNFRFRNKSHTFAGQEDAAEIFAIVVSQQPCVPGTGGFGQLTTHEPRRGLHVKVLSHLAY